MIIRFSEVRIGSFRLRYEVGEVVTQGHKSITLCIDDNMRLPKFYHLRGFEFLEDVFT